METKNNILKLKFDRCTPFEIQVIYRHVGPVSASKYYNIYTFKEDSFILHSRISNSEVRGENGLILDFETIKPYFKTFHDAFIEGYARYEDEIKEMGTLLDSRLKIFDTIKMKGVTDFLTWLNCEGYSNGYNTLTHANYLLVGNKSGRWTRAWKYVLDHYHQFIELFRGYEPFIEIYRNVFKSSLSKGYETYHLKIENLLKSIGEDTAQHYDTLTLSRFLSENGFFHLDTVKYITDKNKLLSLLTDSSKKVCYKIALLEQTGFLKVLLKKHSTKTEVYKALSLPLNHGIDGIKKSMAGLLKGRASRKDYDSFSHLAQAKSDIEALNQPPESQII